MAKVVYSIGVRFAGGGIGNIAYRAVMNLYQTKQLSQLLCSSAEQTPLPQHLVAEWGLIGRVLRKTAVYDRSRTLSYLHNRQYDHWTATRLPDGDIFYGWNSFCLHTLSKAKKSGMLTVVDRASSHPAYQHRLLKEEYAHWNLPFSQPQRAIQRNIEELNTADYIVIPSDFVRQSFIEEGVPEHKLIQVPFGVDTTQFTPRADKPKNQPFRVVFLGQVSIRKGVPYLLKAWERLKWSDAELWLIGHIQADFQALRQQYDHLSTVRWMGHVSNPATILRESDMFVFPTIEEGSALVIYEAMASGLPVITTPNAGSVITSGKDGELVPIRDIEALITTMQMLYENKQQRQTLGQMARQTIENYPWVHYGKRLSQIVSGLKQNRNG